MANDPMSKDREQMTDEDVRGRGPEEDEEFEDIDEMDDESDQEDDEPIDEE